MGSENTLIIPRTYYLIFSFFILILLYIFKKEIVKYTCVYPCILSVGVRRIYYISYSKEGTYILIRHHIIEEYI